MRHDFDAHPSSGQATTVAVYRHPGSRSIAVSVGRVYGSPAEYRRTAKVTGDAARAVAAALVACADELDAERPAGWGREGELA